MAMPFDLVELIELRTIVEGREVGNLSETQKGGRNWKFHSLYSRQ